jgi:hypothetical protein
MSEENDRDDLSENEEEGRGLLSRVLVLVPLITLVLEFLELVLKIFKVIN